MTIQKVIFFIILKNLKVENFDNSQINFKIQKTSNDNYLKSNKIETNLVEDSDVLENSFNLNLYSNNFSIDLNTTVYENLNKIKSDRYEYIYPQLNLKKKLKLIKILMVIFILNHNLF